MDHSDSHCLIGSLAAFCDRQGRSYDTPLQIRKSRLREVEFLDQEHVAKCGSQLDENLTFLSVYLVLFVIGQPV